MEDHPADQLDVEVALPDRPAGSLAGQREGLGQQVIERLAIPGALAQRVGLLAELLVVEQLHLRLDPIDRVDPALVLLELLALPHPEGTVEYASGHRSSA
jgi:hypothetical protein